MAAQQEPSKHHYIPEFFLRYWTSPEDGRLERYDKPIPTKLMVRRVFPSEVGWLKDLYASPGHQNGTQWLESKIFQTIDNLAAPVLHKLNLNPVPQLNSNERSAWTLFLRSLSHRTPANLRATIGSAISIHDEALEELKEGYKFFRGNGDPRSFEEYKASLTDTIRGHTAYSMLPNIMTNPTIGQFLNNLHTRVIVLPDDVPDFLLSDDPLARSDGIQKNGGHIAIPLSPRRIFISAYTEAFLSEISNMRPRDLVGSMNRWTVEGARHFVVSRDRSQDRFIRNRFGANPKPPIMA